VLGLGWLGWVRDGMDGEAAHVVWENAWIGSEGWVVYSLPEDRIKRDSCRRNWRVMLAPAQVHPGPDGQQSPARALKDK
jgi:hypothetical protein